MGRADASVAPESPTTTGGGPRKERWMEGSCIEGRLVSFLVAAVTMCLGPVAFSNRYWCQKKRRNISYYVVFYGQPFARNPREPLEGKGLEDSEMRRFLEHTNNVRMLFIAKIIVLPILVRIKYIAYLW